MCGGLISNTICCAGNCLCHAVANICGDAQKINPKLFSRIGFILLSLISVGVSLLVLFYASPLLEPFNRFVKCPNTDNLQCLGISSVYRMSMSLVILHLVTILFSSCGKNCAKVFNRDCWTFKLLLVFGMYIVLFFVDNSIFSMYAAISRYTSLIFLVYQIIVTLSFAHIINIKLVEGLEKAEERDGQGACKYQFWLLFLTIVFFGLSLYWIVISFMYFSYSLLNILLISLTIFFGVSFTVLSISNIVTRKRLLTSIYVFSFISYLCWSALNSQPNSNSKSDDIKLSLSDILIGLLYLFMALCFLGFYIKKKPIESRIGNNNLNKQSETQEAINKSPLLEQETTNENKDKERLIGDEIKKDDDEIDLSAAYYLFHIFMIFMSIYYCMLLTNWNVIDSNSANPQIFAKSWTSFWVKFSALCMTVLLYIWILIAPILFPDREFDF